MMTLYFLRHGEADWPGWDRPDDERPLTRKGKKEMRQVARFLCTQKIAPARVLSSPLPRAWQTAEIAAEHLHVELRKEPLLGKGFNLAKLKTILKRESAKVLMLVGHEPDFCAVIGDLTGGNLKLAKAGLARVEVTEAARNGRLIWLVPPRISTA
ncbi:MAG: phosphohistidine phosphatase SixA [Chthoniobacterales bacterium]